MKHIRTTPLENHIARKIGLYSGQPLKDEILCAWQLNKINETIDYARNRSPFYQKLFSGIPRKPLSNLSGLFELPFTNSEDIRKDPMRFLCVSQDHIARVVTLQTSGATHAPKRLFFTESDLELTVDFFHHGMSTLVEPGQKALILLPGNLPGSVGDLLVKGLARMDVKGIVHGPVKDPKLALEQVVKNNIDCLVGIPVQVLSMARHEEGMAVGKGQIKSVLLSADYIPNSILSELRRVWGCDVFQHYGMTEMGLGGGVECRAFEGYHLREADLYFEIIDQDTGKSVSEGQWGEVVFTTLTRKGMPLIRYRTGDRGRFITDPCPCKSVLRRMGHVSGRIANAVRLKNDSELTISLLDEAIFPIPGVLNYQAEITRTEKCHFLEISAYAGRRSSADMPGRVRNAVMAIPRLREAFKQNILAISDIRMTQSNWFTTGISKRLIIHRGEDLRKRVHSSIGIASA
jgi:phenylacetate-coenzyme A ligase PaaK-like adenylate-forming protein